jgi:hypothetical protein
MIEEMRFSIRRRSREEAARLVEEYQESGLTRTAFCSHMVCRLERWTTVASSIAVHPR